MRTILIPTDFSSCATNAADVALQLFSKEEDIQVLLYNRFDASAPDCGEECFIDLRTQSEDKLAREQHRLAEQYPNVKIETTAQEGAIYTLHEEFLEQQNVDTIVLGTKGVDEENWYVSHSNAGSLARKLNRDMLIVPESCRSANFENILFTTDYENVPSGEVLAPFKRIVADTGANSHILHVSKPEKTELTTEQKREKSLIEEEMSGIDYTMAEETATLVDVGIEEYINKNQIDLVAVVPRHNSFTDRIFHYSITQKVAERASVPVMIISLKEHSK